MLGWRHGLQTVLTAAGSSGNSLISNCLVSSLCGSTVEILVAQILGLCSPVLWGSSLFPSRADLGHELCMGQNLGLRQDWVLFW